MSIIFVGRQKNSFSTLAHFPKRIPQVQDMARYCAKSGPFCRKRLEKISLTKNYRESIPQGAKAAPMGKILILPIGAVPMLLKTAPSSFGCMFQNKSCFRISSVFLLP